MSPGHAAMTNPILKFVLGIGVGGGVMWKVMNLSGGENNFDHHQGSNNTEQAKSADRLIRRHSTNVVVRSGGMMHPDATVAKQAA